MVEKRLARRSGEKLEGVVEVVKKCVEKEKRLAT